MKLVLVLVATLLLVAAVANLGPQIPLIVFALIVLGAAVLA